MNTGLAGTIGRRILAVSGKDEKRLVVVLMTAVALLSGFMSDTGTVAVPASMAFATPVASPTNTLVMGAGSYSFSDYAKVGVPLIFIAPLLVVLLMPVLFPF